MVVVVARNQNFISVSVCEFSLSINLCHTGEHSSAPSHPSSSFTSDCTSILVQCNNDQSIYCMWMVTKVSSGNRQYSVFVTCLSQCYSLIFNLESGYSGHTFLVTRKFVRFEYLYVFKHPHSIVHNFLTCCLCVLYSTPVCCLLYSLFLSDYQ